ncbi:AcrR family transcriptional regulator [Mycetocola sp. CAN_C7]|uniref:TetR/AcrR family transcriptional regulator n=1 Tax=Mycetocola sp. CAN_C7 TaxID=2787724 RepID=UPI0018CB6894
MSMNEAGAARRGPYAKSAERRRSIVAAAHTVFAAQGYRSGSLQDVADLVGMSQTSLLHYFPKKQDLLFAVLNWRDSITGDGTTPPDLDETFIDAVVRQAAYNEEYPGVMELYTVLCAESLTAAHPGRDFFVTRFHNLRRAYVEVFEGMERDGLLRPGVDSSRAAASLVALWDGIQTQWLLEPDAIDTAACLRDYLQLLTRDASGA